ncbi:MAG: PQQ-binding-like beta-propeller repeat protein [Acidimicrobiales bacterium]
MSPQGRVCWETPLTNPGQDFHSWSGPILAGDSAILDSDSHVFSVDLSNGKVDWEWMSAAPPIVSSGGGGGNEIVAVVGGVVVATKEAHGNSYVVGLDESTGALRWQRGSAMCCPSDTGKGSVFFAFNKSQQLEIQAWADRTGATLWSTTVGPANGSIFPTVGDGLVLGYANGNWAVNAATGKLQWRDSTSSEAVIPFDGLLVAPPTPGPIGPSEFDVPALGIDPTTGATLWSTPPLPQGQWHFVGTGGDLMQLASGMPGSTPPFVYKGGFLARIDLSTGKTTWSVPTFPYVVSAAGDVVADIESTAYDAGASSLVGRNATTGAVLWRVPLDSPHPWAGLLRTVQGPVGSQFLLENAYQGDQVTAYDAQTGAQAWTLQLPDANLDAVTPVPGGGVVVQACEVNCVQPSH